MAAPAPQGGTSARDALVEVAVKEADMSTNEGCAVIRLSLAQPTDIAAVAFRNQYSASITLRCKGVHGDGWLVAVRDQTLMPNPHCEDKGQDIFTFVEAMVRGLGANRCGWPRC